MPVIDHLVLGVPELELANEELGRALGVIPTDGGEHPLLGTANSLVSLGDGQYLEILGPSPSLVRKAADLPKLAETLAQLPTPDLLTFAVSRGDLESVEATAKSLGHQCSGVIPTSRRTTDGALLEWRLLFVMSPEHAGLM